MAYALGRLGNMYSYDDSVPVESHTGKHTVFLRRYQQKAAEAVKEGPNGIAKLGPDLLKWTADTRNLKTGWDYLRCFCGSAPGLNGLKYDDLTNSEAWGLCRALRQAILDGTYQPGPDREVKIPKTSGKGHRTLRLQNIQDRVVARAVVQIIQPLLDPQFDENSFGFRPGRDRRHALAAAGHLAESEDSWFWVLEDVKDAFDQVPLQRLLDIIRRKLPSAEDLWQLIKKITANGTKRGLRQGSPLSPLLLNLYLDHFLDRVWRKQLPDTLLLRSADDLLVVGRTEQEALEARKHLRRLLKPAGMPLKEPKQSQAIRNLNNGDKADWLGFRISTGNNGLEVHISAASWSMLEERLRLAHQKPAAPLRAIQIVDGWIGQIGPCFPWEDKDHVVSRIADMAKQLAFDELPDAEELKELWREGYSRWQKLSQASLSASLSTSVSVHTDSEDDGSAGRHVFFAAKRRGDGVPHGAPSLSFSPDPHPICEEDTDTIDYETELRVDNYPVEVASETR